MLLYRLTKKKYKNDLTGTGASIMGGRWNSAGIKVLYTSSSIALAMAEVLVHLNISEFPNDGYYILTLQMPDTKSIIEISSKNLMLGWNNLIDEMPETKKIGDKFIKENKACLLKVPSAVVQGDYNFLVNPLNKCFAKIEIIQEEPFPFDQRLFR